MLLDAFLKIEGDANIAGESTDSLHAGEIEILSFGHSMGTIPKDEGRAFGMEMLPMVVIKPLDAATPALCRAACARTKYNTVTLSLCQRPAAVATDAKLNILTIKLEPAIITRVTMLGSMMTMPMSFQQTQDRVAMPLWTSPELSGCGPVEQVEIAGGKFTWSYNGGAGNANISTYFDTKQFNND